MKGSLVDHCLDWWASQGISIPLYCSLPVDLQLRMYECWVNYAFAGMGPNEYGIHAGRVYMASVGVK